MTQQQLPLDCVVLDLETTGLDYKLERIIEIGAVKLVGGRLESPFHSMVDPESGVRNTAIHGIDDEMVRGAPTIRAILPSFLEYLGDSPIVAHNALFDYNFLNQSAQQHFQRTLNNPLIDTLQIAREVFPQERSHSLESLLVLLECPREGQAHRALGDTLSLAAIFPTLWKMRQEKRAWQRAQFDRVSFIAQRYSDLDRLLRSVQGERDELRRVLAYYFEEGGEAIELPDGSLVQSERRDCWEYCPEELEALLKEWELYEKLARPEKSRIERWLRGDRLTEEQKERILASRRFLGRTTQVSLSAQRREKS